MPRKKGSANVSKSSGLGDSIEKVTKATGIKAVVETISKVTGLDCGCQERKEWLNKTFSYVNTKTKCMDDDQVAYYEEFKERYMQDPKSSVLIPAEEIERLVELYNSVFQVNIKGCESCSIHTYVSRLENVYKNLNSGKQ